MVRSSFSEKLHATYLQYAKRSKSGLGGATLQLGRGRRPREKRERNLFSHNIFECAAFNFLHLFSLTLLDNKCKQLKAAPLFTQPIYTKKQQVGGSGG